MIIRGKLLIAIFSIVFGFVLVFWLSVSFAAKVLSYKNLENQVNISLADMYKLNNQTRNLMTSEGDFNVLHYDWNMAVEDFENSFNSLLDSNLLSDLPREIQDTHRSTNNIWIITREELKNTSDLFLEVTESEISPQLQKLSLLRFFWDTENDDSRITEHYDILPLVQQLESVQNKSRTFLYALEDLSNGIKKTVAQFLSARLTVVGIMIFLIVITAIIFGFLFSNILAKKIMLVESSLYSISRGNFTQKLNIEGKDEFGRLSRSFNLLMNNLWQKLDSVKLFMQKVQNSMKHDIDYDHSFQYIISEIVDSMEADAGVVLLKDKNNNTFKVAARKGIFSPPYVIPTKSKEKFSSIQEYIDNTPIDLEDNLFAESFLTRQQIISKNNFSENKYTNVNTEEILAVSSFIINPLFLKEEIIGVIGVFKHRKTDCFSELDVNHFNAFSDYTSLVLDNLSQYIEVLKQKEVEKELAIARQIQQDLLFMHKICIPDLELETFSKSAGDVGGDYLNIKQLNKNCISILIGDVSGKGIPASMIMVMIHSICNLIVTENRNPADVLKFLNRGIESRTGYDRFVTMQFLKIDIRTKTVQFANAGHLPLLIFRKNSDSFAFIDADGLPAGIEKNSEYQQLTFHIEQGDILVLYSDGITEAKNKSGEEYGIDRLKFVIRGNYEHTITKMKEEILKDIDHFIGAAEQQDDQTLVIFRL